jgi:hypothetical protein
MEHAPKSKNDKTIVKDFMYSKFLHLKSKYIWVSLDFSYRKSDREQSEWVKKIGCGWFETRYPVDLDPLDETP